MLLRRTMRSVRYVAVALIAALAPSSPAPEAQAVVATCPSGYQQLAARPGVAFCHTAAYQMIVVDTSHGAKMHVVSDPIYSTPVSDRFFNVKSAASWSSHIQSLGADAPGTPSPSKLFAVVNAGFQISGDDTPTLLSMPEWKYGVPVSYGKAMNPSSDPAATIQKRMIRFGSPYDTTQSISFGDFGGTNGFYNQSTADTAFSGSYDGTVGFVPWTAPSDVNVPRPRTMVGWDWDTGLIYVMVATGTSSPIGSGTGKTLTEASNELYRVGADWLIQFDGGRSSQWYSPVLGYGWKVPTYSRLVPEVFAIYGG